MTQRTYAAGNLPAHVPVAQDANGDFVNLQVDANGDLKIAGTFSAAPPVGGATEAEQQAQTALLGAGLPAALSGSGNLKVAIVEQSGGGLTDAELRATAVPVSGPLTDTQLRATAVPVSGSVTTSAGSIVGSSVVKVGVELTRPSDTTAYTAKDVVADSTSVPTVITFADFARVNNGSGIIVRARLMSDQKTLTAGFRLHLFHTAPTAINDNSAYTMLYSNAANRIGMIDFPAMTTEDATGSTASASMRPSSDGSYGAPNLWFQAAAASRAIYGILETTAAFTPASAQKFYIELAAILD